MRGGRTRFFTAAACALALAGCGGGTRQDASEPSGTYNVQVLHASFPAAQSIARQTRMGLTVRNTGTRTVPDLAVTIDSFDYTSHYPELAADKRPVWVIERGAGTIASPPAESEEVSPAGGGQTAYVNTWAFGALAPGATRTLTWKVVPVKSGTWTVHYALAAGLAGKAKARLQDGGLVQGQFAVDIAPKPALTHVNPDTGRVEVGQFPVSP
ncbi:MAG TPA: hypothetical protein VED41_08980 [Solirubrobacteraceae bacterium]|nr:hypothetical protein [Solirubrobacteraceae bacterium]